MKIAPFGQIPAALEQAESSANGIVWLQPFAKAEDPSVHELVFFLKPELLLPDAGIRLDAVLELIDEALARYGVSLGSLSVLTGRYLKEHTVMQGHYGVINRVSREGPAAISDEARARLNEAFGELLAAGAEVLGGHQILEKYPDLTPASCNEVWERKRSMKLAGGTYAIDVEIAGRTLVALNGFHPDQIEHFIAPGRRIVVATVRLRQPWKDLRARLAGATDPTRAPEGSIRRSLLDRQAELGLKAVNQGFNGIHLSAGPLEGLVELVRFASDRAAGTRLDAGDTCFGRLLAQDGFGAGQVVNLMGNPDLEVGGKRVSAFDLTEEIDATEAVKALADLAA